MAKSFSDFRTLVLNKGFDIDGYYGWQCWDGAMKYSKYWGYPVFNCTKTGYAQDIWNLRSTSGILKYYNACSTPKVGDIVVFGKTYQTPVSHIGVVSKVISSTDILVLGQNQGGKAGANGGAVFTEMIFKRSGVLGYLRPKALVTNPLDVAKLNKVPSGAKKISATFKVSATSLSIYAAPNTTVAKNTGLKYVKGNSVKIDYYIDHDGYRWISWVSASAGVRRWMKAGTVKSGKLVKLYGTKIGD